MRNDTLYMCNDGELLPPGAFPGVARERLYGSIRLADDSSLHIDIRIIMSSGKAVASVEFVKDIIGLGEDAEPEVSRCLVPATPELIIGLVNGKFDKEYRYLSAEECLDHVYGVNTEETENDKNDTDYKDNA